MQPKSLRNAVLKLAREHYSTEAEYLWARTPTYGVLRHPDGKWYAAIMDIPKSRLGLPGDVLIDVINVQIDPVMSGSLRANPGIFPGYHMNKEKWITVLLDGTIDMEQIAILLDISYDIAGTKGRRKKQGDKGMTIELATKRNIDSWMALVEKVKGSFPGLETEKAIAEHRKTVLEFMEKGCAICTKEEGRIVGTLLFSKETNMLCFLAVDAEYRRAHIGSKMFSYMLTFMDAGKDITVTTYRADVPEGIPARKFYKKMGFAEGKLTEEFGSPVQELVLKRSKEI